MADAYRVLLVDDEAQMLKALTRALGSAEIKIGGIRRQIETHTARTGTEALSRIARTPCHVVVSDIRMPRLSGLDALGELRKGRLPTPVILITAFGDDETHAMARRLGASATLDKPFDLGELLALVREVIPLL